MLSQPQADPVVVEAVGPPRRASPFRKVLSTPTGALGFVIVAAILFMALFAPVLSPYDPTTMSLASKHQPPSGAHWLGTDQFGRDILTRIMYGSRISLSIGLLVVSISAGAGILMGLTAGYFGGRIDQVLMRVTDVFLAFPTTLFALAVMSIRGAGFGNLLLAMTLKDWATYARLVRAETLSVREREYILAAQAAGASSLRVMLMHILPNVASPILVYGTLGIAAPILSEAALSFLGLGLSPPTPSWGLMLSEEKGFMRYAWWSVTFPGLAICLAVLGFNLFGDALRDALDPRQRHKR